MRFMSPIWLQETYLRPVDSATDAGRRLYRTQAAKAKEKRIKKVQAGKKISKKAAGEAVGIAMDSKY